LSSHVLSSGSYHAHLTQPWLMLVMLRGLTLFLCLPYAFLWSALRASSCQLALPGSCLFGATLLQNPSLFGPWPFWPRGLCHPQWLYILVAFCAPWFGPLSCLSLLFPVPGVPGCYSSSPPRYLSLAHPLSSIVLASDLDLASWESFFLL